MNEINAALKRMRQYTSLELAILQIVEVAPPTRGKLWYKSADVPVDTEGWHTDEIDEQMTLRAQAAGVEPEPIIESLTLLHFADTPLLEHPATGAGKTALSMHVMTEFGRAYLAAVKGGTVKVKAATAYDAARLAAAAKGVAQTAAAAPAHSVEAAPAATSVAVTPKRGRGRPRKAAPSTDQADAT